MYRHSGLQVCILYSAAPIIAKISISAVLLLNITDVVLEFKNIFSYTSLIVDVFVYNQYLTGLSPTNSFLMIY